MTDKNVIEMSLSSEEVAERVRSGKVNTNAKSKSKSVKRIIFDNTITLFNILNLFLAILLLLVGSYKNMLFMGVVFCNVIIGIVQEIRSKRTVDKLSIVVSDNIRAVRDGVETSVPTAELVIDDIIILSTGNQIPSDCEVVSGFCLANESLLTGESDLIEKRVGSSLLSGSYISSGQVYARVIHIGEDNYATRIHNEATYSKKVNSELMKTLNKILIFCSVAIFPVGTALFTNQYFVQNLPIKETVVSVVAALIGMIPEGLILLTSTVLAVSVIRLAKKKVLVQQLFCIETLARVDVLCLDKTGTITTGEMEVVNIDYFADDGESVDVVLKSFACNSTDANSTIKAINNALDCRSIGIDEFVPFSSEKKWSGAVIDGSSYVLGAAEFIYKKDAEPELFEKIAGIDSIFRVLVFSVSENGFENRELPKDLKPLALIVIKDKIRKNAEKTINYFKEQGVQLKVISGDNNKTVEMIARSVGINGAENSVDATTLDSDEKITEAAEKYTVFGRVTPEQKKKLVHALKEAGHTVAMTGDGVNDVPALKEADCSISIASGSDAAKNISQLVLVNNDFASMPKVVAEGRRSINNIQRSASLFLVKTIFSVILSVYFIFMPTNYPFVPIQMSLISAFTIGIPSAILALQPNHSIIKGQFFKNVVLKAMPAGLLISSNIMVLTSRIISITAEEISTMAVIITALVGVMMVIRLSIPFNKLRVALLVFIVTGLTLGMTVFGSFFHIVPLSNHAVILLIIMSAASIIIFNVLYSINVYFIERKE